MSNMINLVKYDFEALKERFVDMSMDEIMAEYVEVSKAYNYLQSGDISEKTFYEYIEPIDYARDYLAHYIAICACAGKGYHI